MWVFWAFAVLPIAVWGFMWASHKKVVWWEAAVGAGVALALAGAFHGMAGVLLGMDTETWSDRVSYAQYQPPWVEYYEEAIYRTEHYTTTSTDSQGRTVTEHHTREVFSHWEPRTRRHGPSWWVESPLGTISCPEARYAEILSRFGGQTTPVPGDRSTSEHASRLQSGDPNDYQTVNNTGWVYPVTARRRFENRTLVAPSLYSYPEVPETWRGQLYDWPENPDPFTSERLLGTAGNAFSIQAWDQLNARLGPTKLVNLICIGFGNEPREIASWQEAHFRGGKKNDLVICFGGTPKEPSWAYVFGWTEKELVKRKLETFFLEGNLTDQSIPQIEGLVRSHYELLDFEAKFAHIPIEPPLWMYLTYFLVTIVFQVGAHLFAHHNAEDKPQLRPQVKPRRKLNV